MPGKILLSELAAEAKEEEKEEAELAVEIQNLTKLKAELAKAKSVIEHEQKEFEAAEE